MEFFHSILPVACEWLIESILHCVQVDAAIFIFWKKFFWSLLASTNLFRRMKNKFLLNFAFFSSPGKAGKLEFQGLKKKPSPKVSQNAFKTNFRKKNFFRSGVENFPLDPHENFFSKFDWNIENFIQATLLGRKLISTANSKCSRSVLWTFSQLPGFSKICLKCF